MESAHQICLVTVGSTEFQGLVDAALSMPTQAALVALGVSRLVVQYGNSRLPKFETTNGMDIELWRFKDGIEALVEQADLVISHAGAGSILMTLRRSKPLIVVVNLSLMDNHQSELAETLRAQGHLLVATPESLSRVISSLPTSHLVPFPPAQPDRFLDILDQEMGYKS